MEELAARDSGHIVLAADDGVVTLVTARRIVIDHAGDERTYELRKFSTLQHGTCISQRPVVAIGDRVTKDDVIAESMATDNAQLALGQNILVAFMFWEGGNYEDAIVVSERLDREDVFTSIHIEKYEVEGRDTKLGAEEITRDIRTRARRPCATSMTPAWCTWAHRWLPMTFWSARSPPRARPSSAARTGCYARSSAATHVRCETPPSTCPPANRAG